MDEENVVFYHGDMDGFASACVLARHLNGRGKFRQVQYGAPVPSGLFEKDVYIVDFHWPMDVMVAIATVANRLMWIDHHKTSAPLVPVLKEKGCMVVHDEAKCGAVLAWSYLFPCHPQPPILHYVQDHDLWQWRLLYSKEVSAGLHHRWKKHWGTPEECYNTFFDTNPTRLIPTGTILLEDREQRVKAAMRNAVAVTIDGHPALVVNGPPDIASDLGHMLAEKCSGIGVVFYQRELGKWVHELRAGSTGDIDVSEAAKRRGGGGHKKAAGFTADKPITMGQEGE